MINFAMELVKDGYPINIFASDISLDTAGFWVSDQVTFFTTPKVQGNENKYVNELLKKCIKYKIDVIIPLMDFELPILSSNKKKFHSYNIEVIVSNYDTIINSLNKKENYSFCLENNIKMPKTFL